MRIVKRAFNAGFNSRARKGRDRFATAKITRDCPFQFTRPQGARLHPVATWLVPKSFNSRARKGRDEGKRCHRRTPVVSIHAPARGATCPYTCLFIVVYVSIHAPARGATPEGFWRFRAVSFQFTRPQGARHGVPVSPMPMSHRFNSRARKGRDRAREANALQLLFQFTRPQGARQSPKGDTIA